MKPETAEPQDRPAGTIVPEAWVDHHGDSLFRFALLRVGDRQVAEDLVQDTFLAALNSPPSTLHSASERTWLISILKHKTIDYLRRAGRRQTVTQSATGGHEPDDFNNRGLWRQRPRRWAIDADVVLENQEFWQQLRHCLSALTPQSCSVFCLREIEQLSADEICTLLSISTANLWTLLHRTRLQLRNCLEIHWFAAGERRASS